MSAHTRRTRMFVAATLGAAALTLTACSSGTGLRAEGQSSASASMPAPTVSPTHSPMAGGGASAGAGRAHTAGWASGGPTGGAAGSHGVTGSKGATAPKGSDTASTRCSTASTRMTATEVSRPLNHVLLTVANTGSKNCDLIGYPAVRFGDAQSVPPAFEGSKPQAVVTLAPGGSGYASVLLSAADGSGAHGYTATSLAVYFNGGDSAAHPSLPAKGVYVDDSIRVTYWQSTMADALAW